VRESYPADDGGSSPAPPVLPEREPEERFQFSLKQLLAFMLACAIAAMGLRYLVQWMESLPDNEIISMVNTVAVSLVFGGLLYFMIRAPFLARHATSFRNRWNALQEHRRAMDQWTRERKRSTMSNDPQERPK
jgi:hypothetical protein